MAGGYGSSSVSSSVSSTLSKDANVNRQSAGRAASKFKGESPGNLPIMDPLSWGGKQINKIGGMTSGMKPGFFAKLNGTDMGLYDDDLF